MNDDQKTRKELIAELESLRRENKRLRQIRDTSGQRQEKTILIVDDNDYTRTSVAAMIRELGYQTLEAGSAKKALDFFIPGMPVVDLVLSDIVMPERSGLHLAQKIADISPDTKLIFMSGYAGDEIVHDEVFKAQHTRGAFVKKPFQLEDISVLIQEQIGV